MAWQISHSRTDYETFCRSASSIPLCCQPWYLDSVCSEGEWKAITILEAGMPLAAWPFFEKQRLGLRYVTMPQFTKHMGVLFRSSLDIAVQTQLLSLFLKAMPKWNGLDQQWSPGAEGIVSFLPKSWRSHAYHTHQIHFRAGEDWRTRINRNMRRNIRKAEQQLRLQMDLDLLSFHELSALSFQRQNLTLPYRFPALLKHDTALVAQERRQIFAAVDAANRIHSVAYLMWSDTTAYYHLSGDDPVLRRSGSGIWLIAKALDFARNKGLQTFDFEGSMIPAIAAIREQFGAERRCYTRLQMSQHFLYQILKWWRQHQ